MQSLHSLMALTAVVLLMALNKAYGACLRVHVHVSGAGAHSGSGLPLPGQHPCQRGLQGPAQTHSGGRPCQALFHTRHPEAPLVRACCASSSPDSALSGTPPLQSRSDWPCEECVYCTFGQVMGGLYQPFVAILDLLCGSSHGSMIGAMVQDHGTEAAIRAPTILLHPHEGLAGGHHMEVTGSAWSWRPILVGYRMGQGCR